MASFHTPPGLSGAEQNSSNQPFITAVIASTSVLAHYYYQLAIVECFAVGIYDHLKQPVCVQSLIIGTQYPSHPFSLCSLIKVRNFFFLCMFMRDISKQVAVIE